MKLPAGIDKQRLLGALARMQGRSVVVLGDFVLDEYLFGRTSRISREAPVLIVSRERSEYRLGGAANVANNLAALGARVSAVSLIGRDEAGERLVALCREAGIDTAGLVRSTRRETPLKTRVLAGGLHTGRQQMLRLDRDGGPVRAAALRRALDAALARALVGAHALAISDYGSGVVDAARVTLARKLARRRPVCGDSRYSLSGLGGLTSLTPNTPEAEAALGLRLADEAAALKGGERLRARLRAGSLLLKRGRAGMVLFEPRRRPVVLGAFGREEVTDVTGAGDTVLAVFTLAQAARVPRVVAACLANLAAGLVVLKAGAATVSPRELARAVRQVAR